MRCRPSTNYADPTSAVIEEIIGRMTPPPLPGDLEPFDLLDVEQDRLGRFLAGLDAPGWETAPAGIAQRRG